MALLQRKIFKSINSSKKWKIHQQSYFLERLSELLKEGFSLGEALSFLQMMMEKEKKDIEGMMEKMEEGKSFPESLIQFGFSEQVISQLHLSLLHANFTDTLKLCSTHIIEKQKQFGNLKKVVVYPLFLLLFSIFMLLAIREVLLPTLESSLLSNEESTNYFVYILLFFLKYLPQLLLGAIFIFGLIYVLLKRWLSHKNVLERASIFCKVPIIGKWYLNYYSSLFSRELSYFYLNGQSIYKIVEALQAETSTLFMHQISLVMEEGLKKGDHLKIIIDQFPFFRKELSWIIYQGELTSQVGVKLKIYSQECHRTMMQDIEKKINLLQPLLFSFIGFIVVFVYAILMLPMLNMIGGF
ncbi:type II secretion system F family protein [Jeotgalibaca sp. MA1X17-3]|uniref:competence type IV pilus assembly protein ComGB n=1 Tax=Jeotgalibaca sp. MA1X17-3 TaxID=2908211 RepID=UPI001F4680F5|nr:competence type IV pilus assembly protein ComGB [Jeotgalibaca sp. MA1X17-3]UJF14661.1 type II secretion system F family protein [Jeotgalibaca sp. MA1X17-3]